MYEMGEEYFAWHCKGWDKILKVFRESKMMWNWWKVQYAIIDEQIVLNGEDLDIDLYRAHHIGLEYWPNRVIVKQVLDSFERAIKNEIKLATTDG